MNGEIPCYTYMSRECMEGQKFVSRRMGWYGLWKARKTPKESHSMAKGRSWEGQGMAMGSHMEWHMETPWPGYGKAAKSGINMPMSRNSKLGPWEDKGKAMATTGKTKGIQGKAKRKHHWKTRKKPTEGNWKARWRPWEGIGMSLQGQVQGRGRPSVDQTKTFGKDQE